MFYKIVIILCLNSNRVIKILENRFKRTYSFFTAGQIGTELVSFLRHKYGVSNIIASGILYIYIWERKIRIINYTIHWVSQSSSIHHFVIQYISDYIVILGKSIEPFNRVIHIFVFNIVVMLYFSPTYLIQILNHVQQVFLLVHFNRLFNKIKLFL